MLNEKKIGVLFVCMGNICRSPAAEAILKHLAREQHRDNLNVASCGIGDWYIGSTPDSRIQECAKNRGIFLTSRAQQFTLNFFDDYDYILVSDFEVLRILHSHAKHLKHKNKLFLMTHFSTLYKDLEIPDPYYKPEGAFELVLDILEDACNGLLIHLK